MFELSVAAKYLTPRWRQLSVSIISLISILVIALVVWLIVVFFSVIHGLQNSWTQKLIALTAPVRVTPTAAYYNSYYYKIDQISSKANYSPKSLHEKLESQETDSYDPTIDEELPQEWPKRDLDTSGHQKDLVKTAFAIASSLPNVQGVHLYDFELAAATLRLEVHRPQSGNEASYISQAAYLGSFDPDNSSLQQAMLQEPMHTLPTSPQLGEGILLPKHFREAGAKVGDRGYLSYYAPTATTLQEQRLPIYVVGFYDPGMMPLGARFILTNREVTSLIRATYGEPEEGLSHNGINIHFNDIEKASQVKTYLLEAFEKAGIAPYWHIETFEEFDFAKDLLQQLRSERTLWTLVASVIIIVACSNIISMLIILVNDKKQEIGILRSMGASSLSIAGIFGACGMFMGMVGSLIGIALALLTLNNLQTLVDLIGRLQGHELLNPLFYGDVLPTQISMEALTFVIVATAITSLLAGIIPAIKASMLRPAAILRSE